MKVEFKEKPYEKYVSQELGRLTNFAYSPDQCDESFLGFDDAFLLAAPHLFMLAPFRRRSRRLRAFGLTIAELDLVDDEIVKRMPPFRFNLFIQYKRPEYLRTKGASEWVHWGSPYYRIELTPHQQAILEQIEAGSHGRAATVYAAPAFWTSADLFKHALAGEVVVNSAFADVARLAGHGKYTYSGPGHVGVGHSEPALIDNTPLRERIAAGLEQNEAIEASFHIIKTAAAINDAVGYDDQAAARLAVVRSILEQDAPSRSQLGQALDTLIAFSEAFDTSTIMLS